MLVVSVLTVIAALLTASGAPAHAAPTDASPVAACAPRAAAPANTVRTTDVGGVTRTYRVHLPARYTGHTPMPLILAFPGHTEAPTTFERYTGLSALPAVVVCPDGLRGTDGALSWQGAPYSSPRADDIAFTAAILREVRATTCVDRSRTYAVGRSNGGGLVSMLACRMPGQFAAYAIVNGAIYDQSLRGCSASKAPASIIDFHGTADATIHYGGGTRLGGHYAPIFDVVRSWAARNGCIPTPLEIPVYSAVTQFLWPLCRSVGSEISHYRITGGAHVWPGSSAHRGRTGVSDSISATALIWQFFNRHPLAV
ncbi:alpha/beta hydrolase family esterase [Gordonia polyisoprenivorans]|uniref:alpha/beta hydrolase family esterase n=1 Tax=Gordonia polyisoprenivorans TaxID=84595 RepID=UPI001FCB2EB7|nr:PHB depolymerase family esterase [Gordonia polyisoprenivorans]